MSEVKEERKEKGLVRIDKGDIRDKKRKKVKPMLTLFKRLKSFGDLSNAFVNDSMAES